jgi:hypothetical protein
LARFAPLSPASGKRDKNNFKMHAHVNNDYQLKRARRIAVPRGGNRDAAR